MEGRTEDYHDIAGEVSLLAEKKRQHRSFINARMVLVALFIGMWVATLPTPSPMPRGFFFTLAAEAATLGLYAAGVRRVQTEKSLDRIHHLLLACELVFHTLIVYYLGGVSWLGATAYLFALMYGVVFLPFRQAIVFSMAIIVSFLTLITLDGSGVIPHQWYLAQGPDRYRDPEFLVVTGVAFAGVMSTVTFWMVFLGGEMRRERDIAVRMNKDLVKAQEQLRLLNDDLEKKVEERTRVLAFRAEHDQMTGLLNRGSVSRRCNELLALARRGRRPLAIVLADGDAFKTCNDRGGHEYGDRVLRLLADCLRDSCRESDLVGRLGGDEFLIVLPDTPPAGAQRFCRRVTKRLEAARAEWDGNGLPLPGLSLGIAGFPEHGATAEELIRVADRAMYHAKAAGGSRWKVGLTGDTFDGHARARIPRS